MRDHVLDQAGRILLAVAALLVVLGRDHDLGAADRLAVDIPDRDLALGVGLQVEQLAAAALVRQHLQDPVREENRRRHVGALLVDFALGAGVAEHHALVAGAFFFAALLFLRVNTHRDVGRLAVQQHFDVGAVIGETVLVVANILDHAARDLGDQLAIDDRDAVDVAEQLAAALARNHDLVGRAQRLAAETGIDLTVVGDTELDVLLEEGIEDRVGDLIRNLVRMALGNRLAGEQIRRAHQQPHVSAVSAAFLVIYPGMSVTPARDDVGFVVEPKPIMLAQNFSGGIEGPAVLSHFRQPVVFDLGDIHRRIPRCKGCRGSDRAGHLVN